MLNDYQLLWDFLLSLDINRIESDSRPRDEPSD